MKKSFGVICCCVEEKEFSMGIDSGEVGGKLGEFRRENLRRERGLS